jgi:uncharacterized protein YndB with AHSA1/START domain
VITSTSAIVIKSSRQKVWDALTGPELVKKWQYGSELLTDWKVGSSIKFRTEWQGKIFEQWGQIIEVVPNVRLKYSLFFPKPGLDDKQENHFIMTYLLSGPENNVTLEIHKEDNRPGAVNEEQSKTGNPVLMAFKELVETM